MCKTITPHQFTRSPRLMACFPHKARKNSMSELVRQRLENLNIISGIVCYESSFCVPNEFPSGPHRPHHIMGLTATLLPRSSHFEPFWQGENAGFQGLGVVNR